MVSDGGAQGLVGVGSALGSGEGDGHIANAQSGADRIGQDTVGAVGAQRDRACPGGHVIAEACLNLWISPRLTQRAEGLEIAKAGAKVGPTGYRAAIGTAVETVLGGGVHVDAIGIKTATVDKGLGPAAHLGAGEVQRAGHPE